MFGKMRPNHYFNYGYSGQMMHQVPNSEGWYPQYFYRNQPFPYPAMPQNYQWSPYQQQNPYYLPGNPPFAQNTSPSDPYQNQYSQKDSQFLFQNPLQPKEEMLQQPFMPMNGYPMMNPYPKQNIMPKQPGGMQSLMNSFKSQDGSIDFNKMINTAGQMMNAVNQVSSLVKGVGGMFKV